MQIERRGALGILAGGGMLFAIEGIGLSAATRTEIKVYKDPSCGCCSKWVKHIEANGFSASLETTSNLDALKTSLGVPAGLRSCHTAIVAGYVLEGHVPAREIARLLTERPKGRGLAVPGMPLGAPGMEIAGKPASPYVVMLFGDDGSYKTFASYG